jgi:membrane protease YdiL (CAAX protease family)
LIFKIKPAGPNNPLNALALWLESNSKTPMTDSPILILGIFAGALYLAKLWRDDYLCEVAGSPNPRALPGATPAAMGTIWLGIAGAVLLVLLETGGEIALGVSSEQTDIAAIFLLVMIGAGILEEVLFRGYFVIQTKGKKIFYLSIIGFSLIFTLLHYQYYAELEETASGYNLIINADAKAFWSLLLLFLNSIWFYTLRFCKWNPRHSLLPCFAAHIASNVMVFVVKLAQGHVTSLY